MDSPAAERPAPVCSPGQAQTEAEAEGRAWAALHQVLDPEVPVLSVCDLGIVRAVQWRGDTLHVALTPTYSGCPATEVIAASVCQALADAGFGQVQLEQRRAPAWTSDWISETGRAKLRAYGIAPPCGTASQAAAEATRPGARVLRFHPRNLACPRCDSLQTERLSAFGATACKALYRCLACREPFEHFKPI